MPLGLEVPEPDNMLRTMEHPNTAAANRLFKMHKLTNAFRAVRRTTKVVGEFRYENDSEHAYQLAMLAWYLIETDHLRLNKAKVFEYCLAHDLPETYAGDVDPWTSTKKQKQLKEQREEEAQHQIAEEFADFSDLTSCLERYHAPANRKDEESKFVYALDKIQPVINILLDGGDFYRVHRVTLSDWIKHNRTKVSQSKYVLPYFESILALLQTGNNSDLFYRPRE